MYNEKRLILLQNQSLLVRETGFKPAASSSHRRKFFLLPELCSYKQRNEADENHLHQEDNIRLHYIPISADFAAAVKFPEYLHPLADMDLLSGMLLRIPGAG